MLSDILYHLGLAYQGVRAVQDSGFYIVHPYMEQTMQYMESFLITKIGQRR